MPVLRFLILTAALLLPGACGFTPMYAGKSNTDSTVQTKLDSITISNIPDREGQYLRNSLIDRLNADGAPSNAAYTLTLTPVAESKYELDVTKNANATRAELRLSSSMTLTDRRSGAVVLSRALAASTSYNVLSSQFTTRVSEQNARQNALDELARQAEQQIVLYFTRKK